MKGGLDMPSLRIIIFLLPLIGLGVGCQKSRSTHSQPLPSPPPVPLGEGTPVQETPEPAVIPLAPEPTEPTTPGSPDNPAEPTPIIPTGNPPETPVVSPPVDPVVVPTDNPMPLDPVVGAPTPPEPPPTELRIKESQFWVHTKTEGVLTFNTPWDETEGDGIIRDESMVPAYARSCLKAARSTYDSIAIHKDFQAKIKPLLEKGVTADLSFLVVVSESDADRTALRRLDRDAYFWHWNDPAKKPVLSMNQYEKGSWVWEVIATPSTCVQPVIRDIGRMFDWTSRRLAEKEGNL